MTEHDHIEAILYPGHWYKTHVHRIPFQVIRVNHTVESVGFYFPTLSIFFIGDGTTMDIPIDRPLIVVYDGLYEDMDMDVPSVETSCDMLSRTLNKCPVVKMVHHGILSFIGSRCKLSFRLHDSVSDLVRGTAHYLDMVDTKSPFLMVGRGYTERSHIVPSTNWFMVNPDKDPFQVQYDGRNVRVFCCLHATSLDITEWKRRAPLAYFEPLCTKPLTRTKKL